MPPATTIDDVIEFAPTAIAGVAYGGVDSLLTQMQLWIAGLLSASGIFPPASNELQPGQRAATNWYAEHLKAVDTIEGPGPGDAEALGVAATINAVVRVANAIKFANIAGGITNAQVTDVITLYNTVWA